MSGQNEDSVGDTPQAPLTAASETIELEGRTYSLLGYDGTGRPHYHLNGRMSNREHIVQVDGEFRRAGWLSDAQAGTLQQMLHDGFQESGCRV